MKEYLLLKKTRMLSAHAVAGFGDSLRVVLESLPGKGRNDGRSSWSGEAGLPRKPWYKQEAIWPGKKQMETQPMFYSCRSCFFLSWFGSPLNVLQ